MKPSSGQSAVLESREDLWQSIERRVKESGFLKEGWMRKEWLPGDASNRFYARAFKSDGHSHIIMVLNAPEAFKSEEVTGGPPAWKELPFVAIGRRLRQSDIRTPEILFVSPSHDFIVLEDLGDELLYQRRQVTEAIDWYEKALDELARLQGLKDLAKGIEFTPELLHWETEHFVEYALLKRQKTISDGALTELRRFLQKVVDRMVGSTYVLCHRDFHSKNLLILEKERRIGVIDFQDALWGPPVYDLASLLRDSYIRLSDSEENHLVDYFSKLTSPVDRELFAMTSLQRNLKAIGRFFYISIVKKRDTHLPFVKPSLERVVKTLKDLNERRVLSLVEGVMGDELQGS